VNPPPRGGAEGARLSLSATQFSRAGRADGHAAGAGDPARVGRDARRRGHAQGAALLVAVRDNSFAL
jgi:hypothetical protein